MSMAWPIRPAIAAACARGWRSWRRSVRADAPNGPAWLVVEKILGAGERLPDDWGVDGTSGYDFMDEVSALLHDAAGEAPLRRLWGSTVSGATRLRHRGDRGAARRAGCAASPRSSMLRSQRCIASPRMALGTRDVTFAAIRRALVALLAHFPVYRSYGVGRRSAADDAAFAKAVAGAMADAVQPIVRRRAARRWLGGEQDGDDRHVAAATVRFQQLSAPLAAKAVEDTAFYRYGVLLSRNEVGAEHRAASA